MTPCRDGPKIMYGNKTGMKYKETILMQKDGEKERQEDYLTFVVLYIISTMKCVLQQMY